MVKKQKETDEILAGISNEKDALERKITELEGQVKEFQKREKAIADAITFAVSKRESLIKEAESQSNSIIDSAEKKAAAIVDEANKNAEQIILEAQEKATDIIKNAEEKSIAALSAATSRADESDARVAKLNSGIVQIAVPLYEYIVKFRDVYEEIAGVHLELPSDFDYKNDEVKTPDEYDNPAEFYHVIKKISDKAKTVGFNKTPKSTYVEPVALTSDILNKELGEDDRESSVEPVTEGVVEEAFSGDVVNMNAAYENADWTDKNTDETHASADADSAKNSATLTDDAKRKEHIKAVDAMFSRVFNSEPVTKEQSDITDHEPLAVQSEEQTVTADTNEQANEKVLSVSDEDIQELLKDILGDLDV